MKKEFWQFWQGKYHPRRKMRVFQSGRGTPAKTAKTLLRIHREPFLGECWLLVGGDRPRKRPRVFRSARLASTLIFPKLPIILNYPPYLP